jgi:hypothetical protein
MCTCPWTGWNILVSGFLQAGRILPTPTLQLFFLSNCRIGISEVRFIRNNFPKTFVLNKLTQVFPVLFIIQFHYSACF